MCHFSAGKVLFIAVLMTVCCAVAQEPLRIAVRGDVLKPGQWSIDDLKRQFSKETQTIKISQMKGAPEQTGKGIPLFTLIQTAEPKVEKGAKHYDLTFLVYVEARDSYRAFFSMAELNPEVGNTQVYLLWEVDGKPLTDKEAPCKLLVVGEKGHSRSIFGIASINLVDGTKLVNAMSSR